MDLPYDLNQPSEEYELSDRYLEISGIWPMEAQDTLAFVEDEAIRVYEFDLSTKEVTKRSKHGPGDSEDIVILGDTAYILLAGEQPAIVRISGYNTASAHAEQHELDLDMAYDPEGLTYDAKLNRLLIACKGSPVKDDTLRAVFAFDIKANSRSSVPALTIDSRDFLGDSEDRFHPSGIALHPHSNDAFMIGTRGVKMIVCYSLDGVFKGAWELDKKRFAQPEGIAFTRSGDLIISSEGRSRKKAKKTTKAKIAFFRAQSPAD